MKKDRPVRRPRRPSGPQAPNGMRANDQIRAPQVRLVASDGEQMGVMSLADARAQATRRGLDLVEVAAQAKPPVCRLVNLSKMKYEHDRKERKERAKQKRSAHQIRLRPTISDHDLQTKLKVAEKYLGKGEQVKVTIQLRQRNPIAGHVVDALVARIVEHLASVGGPLQAPRREGNQVVAMFDASKKRS